MIAVDGGLLITGDGTTVRPNGSVLIRDGRIHSIVPPGGKGPEGVTITKRLDATGGYVIPGVINNHAHCVTYGPLFASAAPGMTTAQIRANLERHLLEGTTTVVNMDGFALKDEVDRARELSPIRIELSTVNTPLNLEAALAADGSGLTDAHRANSWERMLGLGAKVIGEVGAGATLAGMGQDYLYIPMAIENASGQRLNPMQANRLKQAVLGKYVDPDEYDKAKVEAVLDELNLGGKLTSEEARRIVCECVLPSFRVALDGISEATRIAHETRLPVVIHNAAPSKEAVARVCEQYGSNTGIVLAHSNHASFGIEEALDHARRMRDLGAVIDVTSGDFYGARRLYQSIDITHALLASSVVDVISTDYMGGFHDPILLVLERAVDAGLLSLPKAVALATGNVARAFATAVPERGLLEEGRVADLVVTADAHISHVDTVLIGGEVVVQGGRIVWRYERPESS